MGLEKRGTNSVAVTRKHDTRDAAAASGAPAAAAAIDAVVAAVAATAAVDVDAAVGARTVVLDGPPARDTKLGVSGLSVGNVDRLDMSVTPPRSRRLRLRRRPAPPVLPAAPFVFAFAAGGANGANIVAC